MGTSAQQIIVGVTCLVAAFAFGNYINQNPSLGNPEDRGLGEPLTSDSIGIADQGFEKMPVMQHRVASKNHLDAVDQFVDSTAKKLAENAPKLPGPGDLDPRLFAPMNQPSPERPSEEIAPDFSSLQVNNLDSTPEVRTERPPVTSNSGSGMPTASARGSSIKNIVDSFNADDKEPLAPPEFAASSSQDPWQQSKSSENENAAPEIASNKTAKPTSPFNTVVSKLSDQIDEMPNETAQGSPVMSSDLLQTADPKMHRSEGQRPSETAVALDPPTNTLPTDVASTKDQSIDASALSSVLDGDSSWSTAQRNGHGSALQNDTRPVQAMTKFDRPTNQGWTSKGARLQTGQKQTNFKPVADSGQSRLPFSLTRKAKVKLVRMQREASQKIELETTQFAEHVVLGGETLQSISTRYLGKPDFYLDIYLANRDKLANPVDVPAGIVLKIPLYEN